MTTPYIYTIVAACPEAHRDDANQLAPCLGTSLADLETYGEANYQDADENRYTVVSFAATQTVIDAVDYGTAVRPEFDTDELIDLVAAQRALDILEVYDPSKDEDDPSTPPLATPSAIVSYISTDIGGAITQMGLTPIPSGEDEL